MSDFTTQVRWICETFPVPEGEGTTPEDYIRRAAFYLFTDDWTPHDPQHKPELCRKILRHFYTQEIGFETVALWKFKLNAKLVEIMPYYNELYRLAAKDYDPLYDVNYTETRVGESSTTDSNSKTNGSTTTDNATTTTTGHVERDRVDNGSTTDNSIVKRDDTPGSRITTLEDGSYLSAAEINTRTGTSDDTAHDESDTTNTSSYSDEVVRSGTESSSGESSTGSSEVVTVTGKRGGHTYSQMIQEYRKAILNVDMLIIEELEPFFMSVW